MLRRERGPVEDAEMRRVWEIARRYYVAKVNNTPWWLIDQLETEIHDLMMLIGHRIKK